MMKAELYDVVELVYPIETEKIPAGTEGTIVLAVGEDVFEVEFANDKGEAVALCAVTRNQFVVVWQAATEQAVPLAEQVAQIVNLLPQEAGTEVLDFARFLSIRQARQETGSPALAA